MLKGIDVSQRIEFISKEDKDEPKTVFVLKPLGGGDMLRLSANGEMSSDSIFKMIKESIVEIKNYKLNTLSKDEMLDSLPPAVIGELLEQVNSINRLTKEETKN